MVIFDGIFGFDGGFGNYFVGGRGVGGRVAGFVGFWISGGRWRDWGGAGAI
ncbi:hypothetical protein QQ056_02095 [Oscillatoria laete-virens NRMC-F 0139]|nr:hypothetical protein [Oscillatoria laete-virens]MDL5052359.1 hypothetical protein [Oscillatoria laete-virens NRMC-F 0139]